MSKEFAKTIAIDDRIIGPGHPVFIIAEIGVNHNGDMELARQMIDAAADAGADCVKFQTFRAEEFMADRDMVYEYKTQGKTVRESMYGMFKRLEFPLDKHRELFAYARSRKVVPLTSVADPVCMQAALEGGATALKLASEDLINTPLLETVAKAGVPTILSTGMADAEEIQDAMQIFKDSNNFKVAFLHCVSLYPTPDKDANLARMTALRELTGAVVGYSDHTLGVEACYAAVVLNASIIEKHFTLNRSLAGPDHALSSDPEEFGHMVKIVRKVEIQLGNGVIEPGFQEQAARLAFRRSLVASRDLPAGTILAKSDVGLKRPGSGVHPERINEFLGKRLKKELPANKPLKTSYIE